MSEFSAVEQLQPLKLCDPLIEAHKDAATYRPATGLVEALDIAMLLGVPLLLTGDPGVGKTRAAHWLASRLETELIPFYVKSSTAGSDLLYQFDEVARFRDGGREEPRPLAYYLRFNALGKAILHSAGGGATLFTASGEALQGPALLRHRALLVEAFGKRGQALVDAVEAGDGAARATVALLQPDHSDFAEAAPEHRLVLIDELDKAPRDTPNDLLLEVEEMEFNIPELGIKIKGNAGFRPVVIITSNSEKSLPDPFLRRCAFFDIPFPSVGELKLIIEGSVATLAGGGRLVDDVLAAFRELRRPQALTKTPGTAELLAWLDILVNRYHLTAESSLGGAFTKDFAEDKEGIRHSLTAVLKTRADGETGGRIVRDWAARNSG
jgi:MoxR-like ATPase